MAIKKRSPIWVENMYMLINEQAVHYYKKNPEIESAIIKFVYASFRYDRSKYALVFKSFFEKNNIILSTFKSCFTCDLESENTKLHETFILPSLIADNECLDWVIKLYSDNPFPDKMIRYFLYSLSDVGNFDGRIYFLQRIKSLTENRFEPRPSLYDNFIKQKEKLWTKVLLDQNIALSFIEKAFRSIGKDNMTKSEVNQRMYDIEDRYEDVEVTIGLDLISDYSDDHIERDEFINPIFREKVIGKIFS